MIKFVKENFVWMKDIAVIVGIVLLLFLNSQFVRTEKFEVYQKANDLAHQSIITTLGAVDKTLALQAQNNALLVEVSTQQKITTVKMTEIEVRMKSLEALNIDNFMKESAINRAQLDVRVKSLEQQRPFTNNK